MRKGMKEDMRGAFKLVGAFEMKSRNLFVIFGSIIDGALRRGMTIAIPLGDGRSATRVIESIEFLDGVAGESYPAITLRYDGPDELEALRSAIAGGLVLEASSQDAA